MHMHVFLSCRIDDVLGQRGPLPYRVCNKMHGTHGTHRRRPPAMKLLYSRLAAKEWVDVRPPRPPPRFFAGGGVWKGGGGGVLGGGGGGGSVLAGLGAKMGRTTIASRNCTSAHWHTDNTHRLSPSPRPPPPPPTPSKAALPEALTPQHSNRRCWYAVVDRALARSGHSPGCLSRCAGAGGARRRAQTSGRPPRRGCWRGGRTYARRGCPAAPRLQHTAVSQASQVFRYRVRPRPLSR